MAFMSTAKASSLLTAVQLNPEILTDDAAFVTDIIQRAARHIANQIGIERYPDLSQGESISGSSASTDISSLTENELLISIDDDSYYTLELTLGSCTTGADTATELQTQIQAIGTGSYESATVSFGSSVYTITSPTFGESSVVSVSYNTEKNDVARALQLGPDFGGTERPGGNESPELDDMVIRLVYHWYNTVGVEGMQSFSAPGATSGSFFPVEPYVAEFISNNRRVVV